jgi:hypothetical protein
MMTENTRTTMLLVLLGLATGLACDRSRTSIPAGGSGGGGAGGSRATGETIGGTGGASPSTVASGGTTSLSGGTNGEANGGASGGMSGTHAAGTGGGTHAAGTGGAIGGTGGTTGGTGGTSTATVWPVLGGPCSVPGQQSACATVDADPCLSCQGRWLYCSNGTWRETHCSPVVEPRRPVEPSPDAAPTIEVAPDEPRPIDTAPAETAIDGPAVLRGYLVYANELMAFESCGTTSLSWANLQGWEKGIELLPELPPFCVPVDGGMAPCPGTIYVELIGTVSSCSQCGHMGRFRQELRVGAFLAASLTGPAECPFLAPVYPS